MITILEIKAIIEDIKDNNSSLIDILLFIIFLPISIGLDMIFAIPIISIWKLFIELFI